MITPPPLLRGTDFLSSLASGSVSLASLDHVFPFTDGTKSDGTIAGSSSNVSSRSHEGILILEGNSSYHRISSRSTIKSAHSSTS